MRRTLIGAAVAVAALALPAPTLAAPAPTVAATVATAHPVAGVPISVVAQGDSGVGLAPAESATGLGIVVLDATVACPASYAETVGALYSNDWHWPAGDAAVHPFSKAAVLQLDRPGSYRVCAYTGLEGTLLLAADPEATLAQATTELTVARPSVTGALHLAGPLYASAVAQLVGTLASDAPENVDVQLNAGSDACQPTSGQNTPFNRFASAITDGYVYGQAVLDQSVTLPPLAGQYRLCTYAFRDYRDGDPDLVSDSATSGSLLTVAIAPPPSNLGPVIYGDGTHGTRPVACPLVRSTIQRGKDLLVHCPGVTGRIAVALLHRSRRAPRSRTQLVDLSAGSWGKIHTGKLSPGLWHVTIKWSGFLATRTVIAVR